MSATFACACPCGCTRPTDLPQVASQVFARRARCARCAAPAHATKYQAAVPTPPVGAGSRAITAQYQPTEAEQAREKAIVEATRAEQWEAAWSRWQASLPEKFRYAQTTNREVARRLDMIARGQGKVASLAVRGPVGSGKTYLAAAFANQAIQRRLFRPSEVLFGSEVSLLSSAANGPFGEVEVALRRLTSSRYKMIVIDDVGRGTWLRDDMRPKVFSWVMDEFWSRNRIVVLTTNLDSKELEAYMGEGAMDRMRSMIGLNGVVTLTDSMRRRITAEMAEAAQRAVDGEDPFA